MTVAELYDMCKQNNCEHYEIEVKYRDEGGFYGGTDTELWLDKNDNTETIIL